MLTWKAFKLYSQQTQVPLDLLILEGRSSFPCFTLKHIGGIWHLLLHTDICICLGPELEAPTCHQIDSFRLLASSKTGNASSSLFGFTSPRIFEEDQSRSQKFRVQRSLPLPFNTIFLGILCYGPNKFDLPNSQCFGQENMKHFIFPLGRNLSYRLESITCYAEPISASRLTKTNSTRGQECIH